MGNSAAEHLTFSDALTVCSNWNSLGTPNRISSTLEAEPGLCRFYGLAVFKRVSHREEEGQDRGLGGVLGRRNGLCVDIHRSPQGGMPHQFLHHFELGSDAPEQSGVGVSEGMPADTLLNI